MKQTIFIPIIAVVLMAGGIFTWSKATGRRDAARQITNANEELERKLCAYDRYDGKLWSCNSGDGRQYYRTTPGETVADAPDGIYNERGEFVIFCGGFVPQSVAEQNQPICDQYPQTNCNDITSVCN